MFLLASTDMATLLRAPQLEEAADEAPAQTLVSRLQPAALALQVFVHQTKLWFGSDNTALDTLHSAARESGRVLLSIRSSYKRRADSY